MKFKSSRIQNQRIERITMKHVVIGIDIAPASNVQPVDTCRFHTNYNACHSILFLNRPDPFAKQFVSVSTI